MLELSRSEAINQIALSRLRTLNSAERESILLDWWSIDEEDAEYQMLSEELQLTLKKSDAPEDPNNCLYDPLILIALKHGFYGVTNQYLETAIRSTQEGVPVQVIGQVEELFPCPCCEYKSLKRRAQYDICPVCKWEDDGIETLDSYSHANHTTLYQAKQVFQAQPLPPESHKFQRAQNSC